MIKKTTDNHCTVVKGECCKDTQTFVKLDKDQKTSESVYKAFANSFDKIADHFADLPDLYPGLLVVDYPRANAPPDPGKVPVFLRNCNFRI
jgi:hypothetical protein